MNLAALRTLLWRRSVLMPLLGAGFVGAALWWLMPPSPRALLPGIDAGPSRCIRITFAPDGRGIATWHFPTLAVSGADGTVYLYDWPFGLPWYPILGGAALAAAATVACQALIAAWRRRRPRATAQH